MAGRAVGCQGQQSGFPSLRHLQAYNAIVMTPHGPALGMMASVVCHSEATELDMTCAIGH